MPDSWAMCLPSPNMGFAVRVDFIAPMWLVGIGVATAVSVSPNGALRKFDHVAGTVTAVYFCLGGVLLEASER